MAAGAGAVYLGGKLAKGVGKGIGGAFGDDDDMEGLIFDYFDVFFSQIFQKTRIIMNCFKIF